MNPSEFQIVTQWETNQKGWHTRMKEIGQDFQQKSEAINYTVFESMQTVMDYVEETLENLMLPPTEGIKFLAITLILL